MRKSKKNSIMDFIKILICIILCIGVVILMWFTSLNESKADAKYESIAVSAMHKECELNCAAHGVSESELIGPQLKHEGHGRNGPSYMLVWTCNKKHLTLTVFVTQPTGFPMEVERYWDEIK